MVKNIISVIVGYIVMGGCVFVAFTAAYRVLGAEGSFQPGSFEVSGIWSVISVIVGTVASLSGGLACAAISKNKKAVVWLAALVLVLGFVSAVMETKKKSGEVLPPRTAEISNREAMVNARTPLWMLILNPLIGVAGVLSAGRIRKLV